MTRKRTWTTGLLGLLLCLTMVTASGAAEAVIGADVVSAYVWRGLTFNEDTVVQPYLDVTAENGFNLNVWANYDIGDDDNTLADKEFSEVDFTLSYGTSIGPVDLTAGYIEYMFPNGGASTGEVFTSLGTSPVEGLYFGLDAYYDCDEVNEYYTSVSVSYDLSLPADVGLSFGASAGYAGDEYAADGDSDFFDYNASVSAAMPVTEAIELSAFIAYTDHFDKDTLPDQDVDTYGGVGLSMAF